MKQKVILAFSGGLDTTFCVIHLKEQGYDVVTATINTGGFSEEELKAIEEKSKHLGSINHYTIEAQKQIYDQIIQFVIKLNGLYENDYPVMCADRYIIAEELVKIAERESTPYVAHGSTSNGNDQVRFDASLLTLNPQIKILTPIKTLNITREEEIEFLTQKGIDVDTRIKKYSINQNVFGTTLSGSEIDQDLEPADDIYQLTKKKPGLSIDSKEYFTLDFAKGLPVALNGKQMDGLEILQKLDQLVGSFGYGYRIYTGDCIIGIKGRILFEAPGLFALIEAHRKLEQYTLSKKQLTFNEQIKNQWTDLVYSGLYYEPLVRDLESFTDHAQLRVNGQVKIKMEPNSFQVVEVHSPDSLINEKIATYAQIGSWNAEEANGFIKLYSLQQQIAGSK
ncbi:MAG: argininosuccinate synthase [Spirochaetes bacterium]|nr:argininosuccinate synthase [Spirochaetota bacterium]